MGNKYELVSNSNESKSASISPYNQTPKFATSGEYASMFRVRKSRSIFSPKAFKLIGYSLLMVIGTISTTFTINAAIVYSRENRLAKLLSERARLRQLKNDLLQK